MGLRILGLGRRTDGVAGSISSQNHLSFSDVLGRVSHSSPELFNLSQMLGGGSYCGKVMDLITS